MAGPRFHHRLGTLLAWWGWPSGAAHAFRDSLARDAGFAPAYFGLADALGRQGRWIEAAGAYQEVTRLDAGNIEAQGNLILAWCRAGRWDTAAEALLRLIKLRPGQAELHLLRGAVLRRVQRPEEAIRCFRWAVHLPLSAGGPRFFLGEAILGQPGWEGVVRHYLEAVAMARRSVVWTPPAIVGDGASARIRRSWSVLMARRHRYQQASEAAAKRAALEAEKAEALRHCYRDVQALPVEHLRPRRPLRIPPRRKTA